MNEFNNFTIPLIPFYLIAVLIAWSLLRKEKILKSALLSLSFSSGALIFLLVRQQSTNYGNFDIGYSVGMYGSAFVTIPLAVFGWFFAKKIKLSTTILLTILSLALNLLGAYAYQSIIEKNALTPKVEAPLDCVKLPYHCAIRDNKISDIPTLKKDGKDIEAHDSQSRTALWYGIDNLEAVKVLLENGANPESFNIRSETPIAYALVISLKPNIAVAKLLMEHGANINRTIGFRKKVSILNFAIINKNNEVINFVLENGGDPNFRDSYRKTACERFEKYPRDQIINLKKYCPTL